MDFSEEEIRAAVKAQALICEKLLQILDLQGDIDKLMRDVHHTPFDSAKWKKARPEELQRLVLMAAIQLVLFEPTDWVEGNEKIKVVGEDLIELVIGQMKWLKKKYSAS